MTEELRRSREEDEEDVQDERAADPRAACAGANRLMSAATSTSAAPMAAKPHALEQLAQPANASSRRIFCSRSCARLAPGRGARALGPGHERQRVAAAEELAPCAR